MRKSIISMVLLLSVMFGMANAAETNEKPKSVEFGVYITNIFDIDFAKNQYTVQFWSWFHHNDKNYHPNATTEIMNAKSFSRQSANEEVVNGINWDTAKIKATVNQQWKVSKFPFDTQKLSILLEDVDSSSEDLVFKPDLKASKIDAKAIPDGWTLQNFELKNSINSYKTAFGDPSAASNVKQDYSQVAVTIELKRDGWRLFSTTFIGFFVATALLFIAFLVLSIPSAVGTVQQQPRITLIIGALFSAIGSVYGLSAKLPYTTEFTLADSLEITTFAGVALAAVCSVFYDVLVKNDKALFAISLNRLMFCIFLLSSFGLNGYMLSKALG